MAKNKTHKGAKKRIKVTATGKLLRRRAMGSHLLTKKSANKKRKLRKTAVVESQDSRRLRGLLGE
jgi:large subunit ribosomal protein L35